MSGDSLVTRERAQPGTVWPPRPHGRYRQPARLRPLTRMFVDLVQEQTEKGAHAVILSHAELADLSGYRNRVDAAGHVFASRPVQYAVAEALRLGLVEQVPFFEQQTDEARRPMRRATKAHGLREGKPAYRLGPLALVELQRNQERARRPAGWAERRISAEARKLAARNRRFPPRFFERSDPDQELPEEAPEEAQTAPPISVGPLGPPEQFSSGSSAAPCASAPPLALRNPWTREAAAPPPRREGATSGPPPRHPRKIAPSAPQLPQVETLPGSEGVDEGLAAALARLRQRFAPGD